VIYFLDEFMIGRLHFKAAIKLPKHVFILYKQIIGFIQKERVYRRVYWCVYIKFCLMIRVVPILKA